MSHQFQLSDPSGVGIFPERAAAPLEGGTHLRTAVPAAVPHHTRWQISQIGDRWGAFQPWAGSVYWLRIFDSFSEAKAFVKSAVAKAALTQ